MSVTRTFDPLVHVLSSIAQLKDGESKKLQDELGISSLDDLAYLTFDDLKAILPNTTLLKLRKLESVITFITDGHTSMTLVQLRPFGLSLSRQLKFLLQVQPFPLVLVVQVDLLSRLY